MTNQRPRWVWLFFVQLAIVAGAGIAATVGGMPRFLVGTGIDKACHFLGLGVLTFLAVGFFGRARWRQTILVIAAASVLEEVSQAFLPTRTFDLGDMAANLLGVALFGALAVRQVRDGAVAGRS